MEEKLVSVTGKEFQIVVVFHFGVENCFIYVYSSHLDVVRRLWPEVASQNIFQHSHREISKQFAREHARKVAFTTVTL